MRKRKNPMCRGKSFVKSSAYARLVVVFTLVLFVFSSIFNPIYSKTAKKNNKRAASTGRSTKRSATGGKSVRTSTSSSRVRNRVANNNEGVNVLDNALIKDAPLLLVAPESDLDVKEVSDLKVEVLALKTEIEELKKKNDIKELEMATLKKQVDALEIRLRDTMVDVRDILREFGEELNASKMAGVELELELECPSMAFDLTEEQDEKMKDFFEDNFSNIYNIDVSYAKTQLTFLTNEQLKGLICNWKKKHRDLERIKMQMQELKKSAD